MGEKKKKKKKNKRLTRNAMNEVEILYNEHCKHIEEIGGNRNVIEKDVFFKIAWKIFYDKSNNLHNAGPKKSPNIYIRNRINGLYGLSFKSYRKIHHNCIESKEIRILKEWITKNKNVFDPILIIELLKVYPNLFNKD